MPRERDSLGISARAESAFRFLATSPASSAHDVALELGVSVATARSVLSELVDQELVSEDVTGRPTRYIPLGPEPILSSRILQAQASLEDGRRTLADLAEAFRQSTLAGDATNLVEVIVGADNVKNRFESMFASVTTEFAGFDCPPYLVAASNATEVEREQVLFGRGVRGRVVYRPDAFDLPGRYEFVTKLCEIGEQSRVWTGVPAKLFIFDRALAILPLVIDDRTPVNSIVVRPSGLLDLIMALFESAWQQATPVLDDKTTGGDHASSPQTTLIRMLAAGMTDQQIANNLNISDRTLRRRIDALHRHAGTQSRFQLGHVLAAGWFER